MILNAIHSIHDDAGDFIVLVDYGLEGLKVWSQHHELSGAIKEALRGSERKAVVKLVRVEHK